MPHTYGVEEDGVILRTRYSDLTRCTEKGVLDVVKEMLFGKERWHSGVAEFGSIRHDMFCKESLETGKLPHCFADDLDIDWNVTMCEQEMHCTIFPCVELYSTIDAYCPEEHRIIDYKTASLDPKRIEEEGEKYIKSEYHKHELYYMRSKQHLCYALQLMMKGEIAKRASYLVEYWNSDRADKKSASQLRCLGYQRIDVDFDMQILTEFKNGWLRERCERLLVARDVFRKDANILTNQ
ncbi:MAG: hypothetical protein ACI4TD_04245 [Phocaeicola sp.]